MCYNRLPLVDKMRKKLLIIFVALIMMFGTLAGCGNSYPQFDVKETPDKSYAVTSNGGMAVQWGDFIYFINGYKAITDTDGKNNKWGDVVKGGIYYAKLTQGKKDTTTDYYGEYSTYYNSTDNEFNDEFSGFVTEKKTYEENDEEKEIDQIAVNPVVPKLITNGGYLNGGLYIIDDYIYYTSPNTLKDKKGNIQYNLVDFYRTRVDGKNTEFLFRSKSTATKPVYGYYKIDNSVYVVVYEASEKKIYSVRVTSKKIYDEKVLADNVTSAILPQKDVYYPTISQDMPEDYIYYTREIDSKSDIETEGNIVERVRADSSDRKKILSNVQTTLDKVSQGNLFYFNQDSNYKYYKAQNLVGFNNDKENNKAPIEVFSETVASAPVTVFGIMYGENDFVAIGVTSSSTVRYEFGESTYSTVLNKKTKIFNVIGNEAFYVEDTTTQDANTGETTALTTGILYKMNYFTGEYQAITSKDIKVDFLNIDIAGGYVFYISSYNEIAESVENKDDELVPVLAKTSEYLRVQSLISSTGKEWDLGKLDKKDYPDPDAETTDTETTDTAE